PFGTSQTIFVPGGNGLEQMLQSIIHQITVGPDNMPFGNIIMQPGGQNFDFLAQFLNQLENSGPAPAPENRIHAIPTVKITAEQARDNLQCAICMDEFRQDDEAKRLNCNHYFHEQCISRWLRL
ncbi:unnamed protein product, partial [Didymodactylos carnosus]